VTKWSFVTRKERTNESDCQSAGAPEGCWIPRRLVSATLGEAGNLGRTGAGDFLNFASASPQLRKMTCI
jgi:hypothetical protein